MFETTNTRFFRSVKANHRRTRHGQGQSLWTPLRKFGVQNKTTPDLTSQLIVLMIVFCMLKVTELHICSYRISMRPAGKLVLERGYEAVSPKKGDLKGGIEN